VDLRLVELVEVDLGSSLVVIVVVDGAEKVTINRDALRGLGLLKVGVHEATSVLTRLLAVAPYATEL
jgi:hypothetical protein